MTAFYRPLKRLISPPGGMVNRAFLCLMGCSSQPTRVRCRGVVLTHATTALLCSRRALTRAALAVGQGRRAGTPPCTQDPRSPRLRPSSHTQSCSRNTGSCHGIRCPRQLRSPRAPLPWGLVGAELRWGVGVQHPPQQILLWKQSLLGPVRHGRRDTLQKYNYYCKGNARAPGLRGG